MVAYLISMLLYNQIIYVAMNGFELWHKQSYIGRH